MNAASPAAGRANDKVLKFGDVMAVTATNVAPVVALDVVKPESVGLLDVGY